MSPKRKEKERDGEREREREGRVPDGGREEMRDVLLTPSHPPTKRKPNNAIATPQDNSF